MPCLLNTPLLHSSNPPPQTFHLDNVIHVDPPHTCKEIVIVNPPSEAGVVPVGGVTITLVTMLHDLPTYLGTMNQIASLVLIVVVWVTLLASAPRHL
jgi:hypothetical protein